MKTIFFNSRKLVLCSQSEYAALEIEAGAVVLFNADCESVMLSVKLLDTQEQVPAVYMVGEDADEMYAMVCAQFHEVDAAGGVVENAAGEVLLICRNGLWDLPKGHREAGEDIEVTALREVEEECGIACTPGTLICVTDHTYHRDGKFVLKHTYWYRMKYHGTASASPQTEEGITEIRWLPKTGLAEYMQDTYPSIREVIGKYES